MFKKSCYYCLLLLGKLPRCFWLPIGLGLAKLAPWIAKRRLTIIRINLSKCFPTLSKTALAKLERQVVISHVLGGLETLWAWSFSKKRLARIPFSVEGYENFEVAKASGRGIIFCGAHFTCLELVGSLFGLRDQFSLVYQKHKQPEFNAFMRSRRERFVDRSFDRRELRKIIDCLRNGGVIWYAPDQDFGKQTSIFVPFMGVQTAWIKATAKLARLSNALVLPIMFRREKNGRAYHVKIYPPLENFPSGDEVKDVLAYTEPLEAFIHNYPDQYLWAHRRFKTRPNDEVRFY